MSPPSSGASFYLTLPQPYRAEGTGSRIEEM